MNLAPDGAAHDAAHELGHAVYLPHEFWRADRDRYIRMSSSYFCVTDPWEHARCPALPTRDPAEPPIQSGTFGVYDSLSAMNYGGSGELCENDNQEPASTDSVSAADGAAAIELYRSVQSSWAPFQPLGQDTSPGAPLNYQLAPGVSISGAPAISSMYTSAVDMFARGSDGNVYYQFKNFSNGRFTSWSGWNQWTASATSDPAAVAWSSDHTDVAVRWSDNNIRIRTYANGVWSSWSSIGSPSGGAMSAPAISSWGPGRLDVFVRGSDGGLYHTSCSAANNDCSPSSGNWSTWQRRGGTGTFLGKPAAVSWGADKIDVFFHGTDNTLWSIWYDSRGWGSSFYQVGGTLYGTAGTASSPTVSSWGVNRLDVFVRGTDSRLWQKYWDGTTWSALIPLGGILAGDPSANARLGLQRIEIVAPIDDHGATGVWRKYWPSTSAGTPQEVAKFYSCDGRTTPDADEVFLWSDGNFMGQCAALRVGLFPWFEPAADFDGTGRDRGSFGLPNDSLSSLKVGSDVRVRLFSDAIYSGSQLTKGPGSYPLIDSGWNDVVSSLRVEDNSRSINCDDLLDGEFAVFGDANFAGDCVVLRYGRDYTTYLEYLGIATDSISSVNSGNGWLGHMSCAGSGSLIAAINLFDTVDGTGSSYSLNPPASPANLTSNGFNDVVSSIKSYSVCP